MHESVAGVTVGTKEETKEKQLGAAILATAISSRLQKHWDLAIRALVVTVSTSDWTIRVSGPPLSRPDQEQSLAALIDNARTTVSAESSRPSDIDAAGVVVDCSAVMPVALAMA